MITQCGQILVGKTDDDSLPFSVCPLQTSTCARSKRHRVCRQQAHMLEHMCACCRHTRRRFERTQGVEHTVFFSVYTTHTHTHTTTTTTATTTHTTDHTTDTTCAFPHTTSHTTQHATSHGDRETERDRARRLRQRDREEDKRDRARRLRQRDRARRQERREKMKEKLNLCLLNRVKHDSSLISFSASWRVNSFLISANCLIHAVTVSKFSELFSCAVTVFFLPAFFLHKYPVEGQVKW